MNNFLSKKFLLKSTVFIYVFFSLGCVTRGDKESQIPGVVVVLYDQSQSADFNRVPRLELKDISFLYDILKISGGCLAYLPLNENSFAPISQLNLSFTQGLTLKERAYLFKRQEKSFTEFKRVVTQSLASGRHAMHTDFWGGIKRTDRLFREAAINGPTVKILLVLSDAEENALKHSPASLPADVYIIAVGHTNEANLNKLGSKIYVFEGMYNALEYIKFLLQGGESVSI